MTEITIQKITPKESKAGNTYYRVNDHFTVHEKDIARKFEDSLGKTYDCEVVDSEDGKWHNIRKINKEVEKKEVEVIKVGEVKKSTNGFPLSMKVAYAKDLFICMDEVGKNDGRKAQDIMGVACELIEQAIKSLE